MGYIPILGNTFRVYPTLSVSCPISKISMYLEISSFSAIFTGNELVIFSIEFDFLPAWIETMPPKSLINFEVSFKSQ